ncbi:major facilitator superfamily domain-containing protein [Xylaria bambusicola]|uniref:major facilitator superfamily domain-containing protein n=1 Tax=Xylaria bambusicola TaxID=326684 RepID=UPI002007F60E|nr:major facilitator superfamily domain-containing protein [Xylaria bambusicola]KAI0502809.1 major facilitator superfamily domain-containing protein [Xylaria bambusicola]
MPRNTATTLVLTHPETIYDSARSQPDPDTHSLQHRNNAQNTPAASATPGPFTPDQFDDQTQRLPIARLIAAYLCLCLCYFISYLDMTSVTTALPTISSSFHTGTAITWVGAAYLLGQTSFQPLYGRISDIFGRRPILLCSVGCIALGGALSGFARTPTWLFVTRAISGVGSGGISSTVAIIVSDLVSLKARGKYQGMISLAIGAGATAGPFVAAGLIQVGADGWRWTFFVPAIAAGACFVLLLFVLPPNQVSGDWSQKLRKIDWLGVITSVAGIVLTVLAVNSGGILWAWTSSQVLSTLIIGGVLFFVFIAIEASQAKIPIMPLRLFTSRSRCLLLLIGFLSDFSWQGTQYFVPLYFQTLRGYTPLQSATLILPFVAAQGIAGATSGPVMSKLARYSQVLRTGLLFWTLGAGLKLLFNENTPTHTNVIVLVLEGIGVGWVHQPGLVALQANSGTEDRAVATGTRNVLRSLGGVVGVAISSAAQYAVTGAALRRTVPEWLSESVLLGTRHVGDKGTMVYAADIQNARLAGFRTIFAIQVPLVGLCLLVSFFIDDVVLKGDAERHKPKKNRRSWLLRT